MSDDPITVELSVDVEDFDVALVRAWDSFRLGPSDLFIGAPTVRHIAIRMSGSASEATLRRRVGYGGRKGRSAKRRLDRVERWLARIPTMNVPPPEDWSPEQIAEFQNSWDDMGGMRLVDRDPIVYASKDERIMPEELAFARAKETKP